MLEAVGLILGLIGIIFAFESPRAAFVRLVGIKPKRLEGLHAFEELKNIANAQLELEREKQEQEYMPHFTSAGSTSKSGFLSLHIANEGKSVTGVTFPGKQAGFLLSIYPINIANRADARLTLTGEFVLPYRFVVEFYDPNGRRRRQAYEIAPNHRLAKISLPTSSSENDA